MEETEKLQLTGFVGLPNPTVQVAVLWVMV